MIWARDQNHNMPPRLEMWRRAAINSRLDRWRSASLIRFSRKRAAVIQEMVPRELRLN
jgi:hypothetical protein